MKSLKLYKKIKKQDKYKISWFMKANLFFCLFIGVIIGYAAPGFIIDEKWISLAAILFAGASVVYGAIFAVKSEIVEYKLYKIYDDKLKDKYPIE